ncbi:MAG TPA: ATP-dependent DNA helicase RecQ [Blastocatellia bacterium]|nr:ATP-dependent DNA helicase RecQ [Blastocatellia bacterium]
MSVVEDAREALRKYFGFSDFREVQAEAIESVLAGEDTVVVMPTGGGKSLCYQLPAMMMNGVTLVVSPLIALMKDQVDALAARGLPTTFINSSISYSETNRRLGDIRRGRYKLVYVAPERFRSDALAETISGVKVSLFAVDEAHCISHWGHDFRPDYLRLRQAAEQLGRPQIIALTATATPHVRKDISEQLGLRNPRVFVAGFDRPNLALRVAHVANEKAKLEIIRNVLKTSTGSGIIYTATRKSVEQLAAKLKLAGLSVDAYHGGMDEGERTRAQENFMRGDSQAIIATNAFGMGIDKSDIRFIIHYHVPGSIEAYYQEVGRAGRDNLPSDCVLLFNYADKRTQDFFIDGSHPPPDLIEQVYRELASVGLERIDLSASEIAKRLGLKNDMAVYSALVILEKAGHIERGRATDTYLIAALKMPVFEALAAVPEDSNEGALLRDLIYNRNINEREPTDLDLSAIAAGLGLSEGQAWRAFEGLATRNLISVRNAYQGRGIRMLDKQPARALRFDRDELAARAAAERMKLRRMIDFCYYEGCLRRFILNYFGDRKKIVKCGTCSTCAPDAAKYLAPSSAKGSPAGTLTVKRASSSRKPAEEKPPVEPVESRIHEVARSRRPTKQAASANPSLQARSLNEAEVIVVKKILSCVARLRNKFGKGTVAAVLRGSTSKQVIENGLDKLSTYGLLNAMTQDDITVYIKALIEAGCISVEQGMYPTVGLTEYGREVMAGRAEVLLDLPY